MSQGHPVSAPEPELLPCPFCYNDNVQLCHGIQKGQWVKCFNQDCIAVGPYCTDEQSAIRAWNTRAPATKAER